MVMCPVQINSLDNNIAKEPNGATTRLLLFVYMYVTVASLPAYAGQSTFLYYCECSCH